jgi:hypothetical protein
MPSWLMLGFLGLMAFAGISYGIAMAMAIDSGIFSPTTTGPKTLKRRIFESSSVFLIAALAVMLIFKVVELMAYTDAGPVSAWSYALGALFGCGAIMSAVATILVWIEIVDRLRGRRSVDRTGASH